MTRDLEAAITLFAEALRGDGVRSETILSFEDACRRFAGWLRGRGLSLDMRRIATGQVEDWEADLRATLPPETFHDNHRGVQQFLSWYARQHDPDWRARSAWRHAIVESPPAGASGSGSRARRAR